MKPELEPVAGNGLLDRRLFLRYGAALSGVVAGTFTRATEAQTSSPQDFSPPWMKTPGSPHSRYGSPSRFVTIEKAVPGGLPGVGSARTPHHLLEGSSITPSGLHFERDHAGVPDIDPEQHTLLIHGLVRRALSYDLNALVRFRLHTRLLFIECSGNTGGNNAATPPQQNVGALYGLLSGSEWTGIRLADLLDEVGVLPEAKWVIAEGADSAGMTRSIPIEKFFDDAILALYQNGEPVRPEQGFPLRLLLPGWEGNAQVKWLRRLQLARTPHYGREETSKYTELLPSGKAIQFSFPMGVKSFIQKPSFGIDLQGPGVYEVSGLAWSGGGRVKRVDVSADGGRTWAPAELTEPVLSKAITRFRIPWRWQGGPATLISRATDELGFRQPRHDEWVAQYRRPQGYHQNSTQAWAVGSSGIVSNVFY